jgi:hypothetical protein
MPAMERLSRDVAGGSGESWPARRRSESSTASSRISSWRRSRERGSPGDSRSWTPKLIATPSVPHHHSQSRNSTTTSALGGVRSGMTIARAAGRPKADPIVPTVRARFRKSPTKKYPAKRQIRSQGVSRDRSRARSAVPKPRLSATQPRIDPRRVAAVSSSVMR